MRIFASQGMSGFQLIPQLKMLPKELMELASLPLLQDLKKYWPRNCTCLALRGVHVVMAVRNRDSGGKVRETILEGIPNAKLDVMELDLSSLASVRVFIRIYFHQSPFEHPRVREIITAFGLNAGIMAPPFALSEDNMELQFATNHIGHFLLTNLLLETMKSTALKSQIEGRIVIVSAELHKRSYSEGIILDKINDEKSYKAYNAYGQSKLANVLHANELARRFKDEGVELTANSLHPGVISTNLGRYHGYLSQVVFNWIGKLLLKYIPQGAATICYLALNPQVKKVSGEYFADSNISNMSSHAKDQELAKKLWDFSLNVTNSK